MQTYQITFEWPNSDWTWTNIEARDFHQSILLALNACPATCRVISIQSLTPAQIKTNASYLSKLREQ
jgi:hypothetical protein